MYSRRPPPLAGLLLATVPRAADAPLANAQALQDQVALAHARHQLTSSDVLRMALHAQDAGAAGLVIVDDSNDFTDPSRWNLAHSRDSSAAGVSVSIPVVAVCKYPRLGSKAHVMWIYMDLCICVIVNQFTYKCAHTVRTWPVWSTYTWRCIPSPTS